MSAVTKPPWTFFTWHTCPRLLFTFCSEFEREKDLHIPIELIEAKNRIETCAPQNLWEFSKKITNPYELIYTYRSEYVPASLSAIKPLSRSYFKMIEILQLTGFLEAHKNGTIRTAHVCEGPGGFIEAIYDIAMRNSVRIKRTNAMTLRSTRSHIPGWRRAQHFMNRNRQIAIEYGPDNTGNILKVENRQALLASIQKDTHVRKPVNIFTADGGFDFTSNYLAQEESIFQLLLASVHTGLSCLAQDGLMVLKIFDYFAPATFELIGFLAGCFEQWTIYKPATSRPCNSEQYFIGMRFRGVRQEELDGIERAICANILPKHLIVEPIPEQLAGLFINKRDLFVQKQISFLNAALERAEAWSQVPPLGGELAHLWGRLHEASMDFCRTFHIITAYPPPPIVCRLALPPADLDEIHEEDTSQPDVCPQSSKPDDVTDCPTPSAPS